ncbi:MAG: Type II restriction m6 adenine DNA methyltransferase, Alw26I/Eco31I/Esp3I family domain protein [Candidatus Magasanikbacteria bacterium GW2011_GWE2_42_7]|uniref:site-specific DNA-methyltransferase (adenine-specific) n=1 Tax=Candidatus Magasanikbacteria bacterium GW2011_GWE2_42_7 TaxID=1619052 RepID=A0A0G1E7I8_9BACT|nr:MAG: Type II restriction m6 adenine DNA methyltransferase, Alw26I/Eco31I/Esp3I family domain protein [Candidatus Magasanikbacteria bacterium GW2011_GWE2_42_7]
MNEIFKIYNSFRSYYPDSNNLLVRLFSFFDKNPKLDNQTDKLLYKSLQTGNKIDPLKIYQLIGLLHQKQKESEKIVNTDKRKHFGIYYTDYSIARLIAKESLSESKNEDLLGLSFYEPCSGTGIFVIAYIDEVLGRIGNLNYKVFQKFIDQIYFSDIDFEAIDLLIKLLPFYIKSKYGISIKINSKNYFKGDVLFSNLNGEIKKVSPKDIFRVTGGFDVVLTNPPYKLLKANGNKYKDELNSNQHALDIKSVLDFIRTNNVYKFNQGTLNYYKIFLEEILENYTHQSSKVGAIIPITLLNDKQSELLRKRIINKYKLFKIYIIPEKNEFFPDISQAFCFFALDKKEPGNIIRINPKVVSQNDFANEGVEVNIDHIEKISETAPIVIESEIGWKILQKLNAFPKLRNLASVCNARGELDLTLDKGFITKKRTSLPLLRGNNISEFSYTLGEFFTDEKFMKKTAEKNKYISRERLVCQQISNIHLEKRLKFTKIPENIVLGNSCNFLTFDESLFGNSEVGLDYLLGILNSMLLNWRFKITNSNNHISNYELAELPIVLPSIVDRNEIEKLVSLIKNTNDKENVYKLNAKVFELYGLNTEEINYVLGKHGKLIGSIVKPQKESLFAYGL